MISLNALRSAISLYSPIPQFVRLMRDKAKSQSLSAVGHVDRPMARSLADMQKGRGLMPPWKRFVAFSLVGIMGIGVQTLSLIILADALAVHYLPASLISVEAAILHNFLWHEFWTWADRDSGTIIATAQRLLRFHFSNGAVSLSGNLALMPLFIETFGLNLLAANLAAISFCSMLNFLAADRLVFTPK